MADIISNGMNATTSMGMPAAAIISNPVTASTGAAGDWLSGRADAWFGTDAPPQSSPKIEQAADSAQKIGGDQFDFNKGAYDANQQRLKGIDQNNAGVVDNQLGMSQDYLNRSNDEWSRFKSQFAPVQDRMVSDAMNVDSATNQERAAAAAGDQVKSSIANNQEQKARQLASMGVNPASGRSVDSANTDAMTAAAQESTAMNNARDTVKQQGITARQNVAGFGQNVLNNSMQLGNQSVQTGNSAVNVQNVGLDNALKNDAVMNEGFNAAQSGNKTSADILNQDYANKMQGYAAEQQGKAGIAGAIGGIAGLGATAAIMSSKKLKVGGKPVSDEKNLHGIKATTIRNWKYKKGVADEGNHVGAYAEDMQKNLGDTVAPKGKAIDVISAIGVSMSATRALAKQVDKLSAKVDKMQRSA